MIRFDCRSHTSIIHFYKYKCMNTRATNFISHIHVHTNTIPCRHTFRTIIEVSRRLLAACKASNLFIVWRDDCVYMRLYACKHTCVSHCIYAVILLAFFSSFFLKIKKKAGRQAIKHSHNILYIDCITHMFTIVCSPSAFSIYMKLIFMLKDRHQTAPLWSHLTHRHAYIN